MIKGYIKDTGTNSGKTLVAECIVEDGRVTSEEWTSVWSSMWTQASDYCEKVKAHPVFGKSDFNIIGLS